MLAFDRAGSRELITLAPQTPLNPPTNREGMGTRAWKRAFVGAVNASYCLSLSWQSISADQGRIASIAMSHTSTLSPKPGHLATITIS